MVDVLGPLVLTPAEKKLFEGQPDGFPLGDFDIEAVMLPDGDDMGIPSDDDEDVEEDIVQESGFGSVVGAACMPTNNLQTCFDACRQGVCILCFVSWEIPDLSYRY